MDKRMTVKTLSEVERIKRENREGLLDLLVIAILCIFAFLVIRYAVLTLFLKPAQNQIMNRKVEVSFIKNKGFATLENKPVDNLKKQ